MTTEQSTINAADIPAPGHPLGRGIFITRYWLNGQEFALVDLGAEAEFLGAWGEYGQDVDTTHGDGKANTRAMAAAGSDTAQRAINQGAFIPSALEAHLLMVAKEAGLITDLRDDRLYWTSTQYSANLAYNMDFEDGWKYLIVKDLERLVRPVRSILILH